MEAPTLKHGEVEESDIQTDADGGILNARYIVKQPDGSRWSVRFYGRGNVTTREPDGTREYHTPSIGRAYRHVAGDCTVHWTELVA